MSKEIRTTRAPTSTLACDLIDWDQRLAIERPLLERLVADAPAKRVLDLGCGAGHHVRLLAELGCEVVGIEAVEPLILRAHEAPVADVVAERIQYILTDMGAVERSVHGHFGAAVCLGDTLPHLLSPESVTRMLVGLKRRLVPGAPVLLQQLNYDRVRARPVRALPVEIVPAADGELTVVRTLRAREDGIVQQTTTALRERPRQVPATEVVESNAALVRGWTREEVEIMLDVARFRIRQEHGGMDGARFDIEGSRELVIRVD